VSDKENNSPLATDYHNICKAAFHKPFLSEESFQNKIIFSQTSAEKAGTETIVKTSTIKKASKILSESSICNFEVNSKDMKMQTPIASFRQY
jgi:hypothetical protein